MAGKAWAWRAAGWDGLLPIAVLLVPWLVRLTLHKEPELAVFIVIVVSVVAAVVRASFALRQIVDVCGGRVPLTRQLALTGAILLLWLFEMVAGLLALVDNEPAVVWLFPAGIFILYLTGILFALRPSPPIESAHCGPDSSLTGQIEQRRARIGDRGGAGRAVEVSSESRIR